MANSSHTINGVSFLRHILYKMDMNYFDAEKTRDNLVEWIRNWFEQNGKDKRAVIGISGGKDSTIVAGLCVRALGKERVLGVLMPNGDQKDIRDSYRVCEALDIDHIVVNIGATYNTIAEEIETSLNMKNIATNLSEQTLINITPRLRMTTLYGVSQTVGGRVVNTSNLSEAKVGYFTRWGDECGDMKPLVNLTKSEVVAIGKTMTEIPIDLIEKTPSDGLSEQSDEEKIGFSYDNLDKYIRNQKDDIPQDIINKIVDRMNSVAFKLVPVNCFFPTMNK